MGSLVYKTDTKHTKGETKMRLRIPPTTRNANQWIFAITVSVLCSLIALELINVIKRSPNRVEADRPPVADYNLRSK